MCSERQSVLRSGSREPLAEPTTKQLKRAEDASVTEADSARLFQLILPNRIVRAIRWASASRISADPWLCPGTQLVDSEAS